MDIVSVRLEVDKWGRASVVTYHFPCTSSINMKPETIGPVPPTTLRIQHTLSHPVHDWYGMGVVDRRQGTETCYSEDAGSQLDKGKGARNPISLL
jgi:hypothetical protein